MLKILFKPTGNIFTLPDAEVMRIVNEDKDNYRILDAGYLKKDEEKVTQEQLEKIVFELDKKTEEIKELEEKEEKELIEQEEKEKNPLPKTIRRKGRPPKAAEKALTYDNLTRLQMEAMLNRLGMSRAKTVKMSKIQMWEQLKELGIAK